MSDPETKRHRLMLMLERHIRKINSEVINPEFPELKLEDLEPIIRMVARARGAYLKEVFKVTLAAGHKLPSSEQVDHLTEKREIFEELLAASKALETAIDRGYLDVQS